MYSTVRKTETGGGTTMLLKKHARRREPPAAPQRVYAVTHIFVTNGGDSLTGERFPGFVDAVRKLGTNGEEASVWLKTQKGRPAIQSGRTAVNAQGHLEIHDKEFGLLGTVRKENGGLFYHHES